MANLVLYRKYRPKSFAQVVGQEDIVKTLRNAVAMRLISHAYLFTGPRGSGKTTMARLLAKAVNCEKSEKGEPCNSCEACEEINSGRAIDLIEIDAASNRGIDEIRDLKEGVRFTPTRLQYKVYVIDEAHQLTKEAANALLKTLEEPPSHAIFILATTEAHKMISTILSRCQRFDFRKLTVPELIQRLQTVANFEKAAVEKEALELIARQAGGSFRDAESLLDKVLTFHSGFDTTHQPVTLKEIEELLGVADLNVIAEFAVLLQGKQVADAMAFLHKKLEEGTDPQEFAKNLLQYLRQTLILKVNPALVNALELGLTKEQEDALQQLAKKFDAKELQDTIEQFAAAENKMKYASIIQLPLELAILTVCGV